MHTPSKTLLIGFVLTLFFAQIAFAGDLERRQAKRIHDRLTGVPATNAVIDVMEGLLVSDLSVKTAAAEAIKNPAFYNVTLKNFAAPWTNEEQSVFVPLNDYTAIVIGMIRDNIDFREVLYGDIIYTGNNSPAYSDNSNAHYVALENLGPVAGDLSNNSILIADTQSNVTGTGRANPLATAGVITSRAAARAFFIDGTNRAMFRFTMINHLCTDLEPLKDVSRTPDRVRQDTTRSPGGDSRIYLNNCVGCHAGMDGMAGAYAYYDYLYPASDMEAGSLNYSAPGVQPKHLINADNFKPGYITSDDSWINYWRNGQNALLGWDPSGNLDAKGHAIGNGAKELGIELANTQAFAQCQVDKVFQTVCFRDPNDYAADRNERDNIVAAFKSGGYQMKQVFGDVAAWCKGN